ncbi:hypothetical protein K1T71_007607 [Dendrolimus kikuchii]|uniref:Uncharacterized protein n=1 Tax=Dendrolimus kikuchii TaxID=765133 RepID=A0ACC1CYK5_9NEOP|nr:hypothetical protein K1T71_007607 [Dendrolimus kikuchii]
MSDSTSPSVLSYLRQYRFQRKPNETSGPGGSVTVRATTSNSQSHMTVVRMQTPAVSNGPIVYKRIRLPESDSDDSSSPMKKVAVNNVELTTAVKERRFRNMLEMFPDISPILVKNVLVKHTWNEERSRDELLKHDPESNERGSASSYFPVRASNPSNSAKPNGNMNIIRVTSSGGQNIQQVAVRKPLAAKGGRARRGSSGSEDDDYGVRKGKDDLVYDSDDSDNEVTDDLIGDKKKVFEFLNTSNLNELTLLSGCSQKKAEAIIAQRPFKGWLDMVEKFNGNKMLSTELLNATQELLATRNNIQRLMKKCVGLAQQLEAAVAAGAGRLKQPSFPCEVGTNNRAQFRLILTHLTRFFDIHSSYNWSSELARWCPSLRVSKYYGPPEERRQLRIEYAKGMNKIDVVLTTYTMVSSCPEERKMFRVTPMHYVIYDEAHMLKNMSTQRYDNLLKIKSKHRLLLTGTPLQNNLLELMSLLCFVMPHMFSGKTDDLKNLFQKNAKSKTTKKTEGSTEDDEPAFEKNQIVQAKRIMKPFVLRRLKKDVLQDLPKKENHTELCSMSEKQERLYKELIAGYSTKNGAVYATTEQNGMSMMMDMRKLANHPLLLRYHYQHPVLTKIASRLAKDPGYKEKNADYALQDLLCLSDFQIHQLTLQHDCISRYSIPPELILDSGKFQKLDEMLPKLKEEGHRVLVFSQFTMMLDILEPYLAARRYRYLRLDGSTAVTDRQDLIDQYNSEDIFVFLLSTKAGGLGINLTAADTVIIHDIDFNPYNDKQAEDRCHRMGQTRPVTIYRLLSKGTIEEGIYQIAQEKLNLEKHVTGDDDQAEQKNVVRLLSSALGLTATNK